MTLVDLPLGRERRVNAVLVEGAKLTLVDTGVNDPESIAILEQAIAGRGHQIEDLQQIVITHAHPDHFGAARQLAERSGATVIADPVSAASLVSYPKGSQQYGEIRAAFMREAGAPETLVEQFGQRGVRTWVPAESVPVGSTVDDGDQIQMGDTTWQVVQTPGHAISEISFVDRASRTLLSGDIILGSGGASVTLYAYPGGRPGRWVLDILASLDRLATFQPRRILPGHGREISDGARAIAERRAGILRRLEEVERLVQKQPLLAWEVSLAIYEPPLAGSWPSLFQTIGYLEALEAQGKIRSTVEHGQRIYGSH
ncbi:MAG TPA: MBL fold metallo-hydrolase [Chloroflexota bacterium]|nr:MBL fold metallo-hydrolase [Chloroflexota bacterium]